MAPRTMTYTVAQIAAWVARTSPDQAPFGLHTQLAWYHHTKTMVWGGNNYHHRRFGNVKASLSRNKREGKYLRNGPGLTFQFVKGWGMAVYEDYSRTREGSPKS